MNPSLPEQEIMEISQTEPESYPTSELSHISPTLLPPIAASLINTNAISNGTRAAITTEVTIKFISNVELLSDDQVRAVFQAINPRLPEIGISCQLENKL